MNPAVPPEAQDNSALTELVRIGIALSNEKDLAALLE